MGAQLPPGQAEKHAAELQAGDYSIHFHAWDARALFDTMARAVDYRSEEHTSELQSLMRISYAVFCLKKKKQPILHNKIISSRHTHECIVDVQSDIIVRHHANRYTNYTFMNQQS